MKYYVFFVFFVSNFIFSQDIIGEVDRLISKQKFASAFSMLQVADPTNTSVEFSLKKIDIALAYFIDEVGFRMFSFIDVPDGQTLEDAINDVNIKRLSMSDFPIDLVLDSLIIRNPTDGRLYQHQADFYYLVYSNYKSNWFVSSDEILNRIMIAAEKAIELNVFSYLTYFQIGFVKLQQKDFLNAIIPFKKSIQLEKNDPIVFYNIAITYYNNSLFQEATIEGIRAFELYKDSILKSDAANLVGMCFVATEQYQKAIDYFNWSFELNSKNKYTLKQLFNLQLKLSQNEHALKLSCIYHELSPNNPMIVNDILQTILAHKRHEVWTSFVESQVKKFKKDYEVLGVLYFYHGLFLDENNNTKKANSYWDKAEKSLAKVYPKDHEVFSVLHNLKASKSLNKKDLSE
jgi:tetratricopeptide (TPR) repeat protein